jgi:hypothetical protein
MTHSKSRLFVGQAARFGARRAECLTEGTFEF